MKPGDHVVLQSNPGFDLGVRGYANGPKVTEPDYGYGISLQRGMVGCIIEERMVDPGYAGTCWYLVEIPNVGRSWFPMGWIEKHECV